MIFVQKNLTLGFEHPKPAVSGRWDLFRCYRGTFWGTGDWAPKKEKEKSGQHPGFRGGLNALVPAAQALLV